MDDAAGALHPQAPHPPPTPTSQPDPDPVPRGPEPAPAPEEAMAHPDERPVAAAQHLRRSKTAASHHQAQCVHSAPPSPSPSKRRISQVPGCSGTSSSHSPSAIPKRAKPDMAPPKILPLRYEHCPVEDMVVLIAHMLGELIETNDALSLKSRNLTRFHSRTAPGISVLDYLHRLAKHATLTPPLLLSMVYYIDRLCAMYADFTINTLTVHRFLITAATVAAKGLSDAFWNNSTYARVGGVKVAELNLLELEFLRRVDWKIVPNPEVLVAYYKGLVERCPGYELEAEEEDEDVDDEEQNQDDDDDDDDDGLDDNETFDGGYQGQGSGYEMEDSPGTSEEGLLGRQ